ncbi:MAG: 2-isopropylmalate synthase [Pseudomonadota bacterium]
MRELQTDRVRIFDTTLRDGEQAPGCSMTLNEKLRIARALDAARVDVIEAGFAAASPGDLESVKAVASVVEHASVASLARCNPGDIEKAWEAVSGAKHPRIHVFVATSEIHRTHKLNMAQDEIVKTAVGAIKMARELCDDIEFSPEDASRTEPEYLTEIVTAAIEAGATTINIPDTVGYTVPHEFEALFRHLVQTVPNIDQAVLSVHCHDDLGMAVANSLAAVLGGARQVECTINGIGERAGNCSLEEIVMALDTRNAFFGVQTNVDTTRLYPTARLVSSITGMQIPRNKAIVGDNAFAHEAGIHQHGMLKHASTYEIMKPERVGISRSNLVLGKHSGRHAFRERIVELGFEVDDFALNAAFGRFKELADKKKDIYDSDIEALLMNDSGTNDGPWSLGNLMVTSSSSSHATATVSMRRDDADADVVEAAVGSGPVEAACTALERITGIELELQHYDVRGVSIGEDAQGEVTITVGLNGASYRGHGISTDIVEASVLAWLEVTNRILRRRKKGLADLTANDLHHANL